MRGSRFVSAKGSDVINAAGALAGCRGRQSAGLSCRSAGSRQADQIQLVRIKARSRQEKARPAQRGGSSARPFKVTRLTELCPVNRQSALPSPQFISDYPVVKSLLYIGYKQLSAFNISQTD